MAYRDLFYADKETEWNNFYNMIKVEFIRGEMIATIHLKRDTTGSLRLNQPSTRK
jgi:hypothetical protein